MHGDQHPKRSYVCGFALGEPVLEFDVLATPVLLLKKASPEWQAGYLNGVGGKIELGEGARSAMAREFQEETGLATSLLDWSTFHIERWRSGVTVYFMLNQKVKTLDMLEAEERMRGSREPLCVASLDPVGRFLFERGLIGPLLYNLPYLLPMALAISRLPEDDRPL